MTTQIQIRGAAQATQEARTLAARELDINTTDGRLCVHNGSTVGGIPHINCFDIQNQEYTAAVATGTDSIAITLARAPAAYANLQRFTFKAANTNTGSATLNVNSLGAKTIKKLSGTSLSTLSAGDIVANRFYEVIYDGTDMILMGGSGGAITLGTPAASASGTSIDYTGIPSSARRITINMTGLSTTGTDAVIVQIGDAGGIETSGYVGCAQYNAAATNYSNGFIVTQASLWSAAAVFEGRIVLELVDAATFTWSQTGVGGLTSTATPLSIGAGSKSLSAALDRIRITTVGGTDTFDAGKVNITYQ